MNLGSISRMFDVVESTGVLHHLADPFAGWRILVSLTRPRGLMGLGFYSEIAGRRLAEARDFIAAQGYRGTSDDIRRFRQDLLAAADDEGALATAAGIRDFFSLNECRDLLFHVEEHRFTLPQIADFIAANGLQFLGFEIDWQVRRDYARKFPDDVAMTDLANWHQYEIDNPRTFIQMYQFWVRKP
jgi:hypothetical protein